MKITFKINGRPVNPNNMADAIMAAMLGGVKKSIEDSIKKKLNPEERSQVSVKVSGKDLKNLSLKATGPDDIIEKLKDILK